MHQSRRSRQKPRGGRVAWTDVLLGLCVYVREERGDGDVVGVHATLLTDTRRNRNVSLTEISAVSLLSDTDNSAVSVARRVRTSTTWNQS